MGSFVNRHGKPKSDRSESSITRREAFALAALGLIAGAPGVAWAADPQGQLTWGIHVSLAPTWFDPAETPGLITPFMILYALHDALVKPMPGQPMAPSLAEEW
jgi:peptide/nickel transport system substrate-binding protein